MEGTVKLQMICLRQELL